MFFSSCLFHIFSFVEIHTINQVVTEEKSVRLECWQEDAGLDDFPIKGVQFLIFGLNERGRCRAFSEAGFTESHRSGPDTTQFIQSHKTDGKRVGHS